MVLCFFSYAHKRAVQSRGVHDSHTQSNGWWPLYDIYRNFHWNLRFGGEYKPAHLQTSRFVSTETHILSFPCPFSAGFPDGVIPSFQGPDWETCVSLWLDGHDHGTEQVSNRNCQKPSAVCCSSLNIGLFSATAGLHINSCIHTTPRRDLAETVKLGSEQRWWKWLMWQCERWCERCSFFSVLWAGGYCCVRGKDRLIGSLKAEVGTGRHKGGREGKRTKAGGEVEGTVVYSE